MELFEKIAEKAGITKEEVEQDYKKLLEEVKSLFPSLKQDDLEKRTKVRLMSFYRKRIQSGIYEWTGYVLGYDDVSDRLAKKKARAIEAFKNDKAKAISEGLTDESGIPIQNDSSRKTFGKPLGDFTVRNVYGIAYARGKAPKRFSMLENFNSLENIVAPPIHKVVKFQARLSQEENDTYMLGSVSGTKFEATEDKNIPDIKTVVEKFFKSANVPKLDPNSDVMFPAIIDSLNIDNAKVVKVSLEEADLDTPSITVFFPKQFDFSAIEGLGEQTKAYIWARVGEKFLKEDGSITMNGYGIWVLPEWRASKAEGMTKEEVMKTGWDQ